MYCLGMKARNQPTTHAGKPAIRYITDAFRSARRQKHLSQRALSDQLGIPQGHLSKIENGEVDPRLSSVIDMARTLGYELTLVPRELLPAMRSLENSTPALTQLSELDLAVTRQALMKLQHLAEQLVRAFPDIVMFKRIQATALDLQQLTPNSAYAKRLKEMVEELRPNLATLVASPRLMTSESHLEFRHSLLQQLSQSLLTLRKIRAALAHGAVEPAQDSVPAYQLAAGDEQWDA